MRRQGPLTLLHLLVTGLVVVVVLAQLSWWTLFTIRESRARLGLEQGRLRTSCQLLADRVDKCLQSGNNELRVAATLSEGAGPAGTGVAPTRHFTQITELAGSACDSGWQRRDDRTVLVLQVEGRCIEGTLRPITDWLELPAELTIGPAGSGEADRMAGEADRVPCEVLPAPLAHLCLHPRVASWQIPIERHHRRLRMFLSEGAFFVVLVLILVGLAWKTVRRDMELELQHRNFISAITHELKSPLAAVRLSLETVLRGRADSDVARRFLENALQDIERLQSLVQKVLEVTRYGLGDAALKLDMADLSAVVGDAADTFSRRATAAGATLEVDIQPGISVALDPEAFAIVVSNLLENAIEYGGTEPVVGLTLVLKEGQAVLEVHDNGPGIADEDQPFIFDRFFRGGDEMTRTTRGTGLGLYLVRQIVSAHRGSVEIGDTGRPGTTVRVILPDAELREERP